MIGYGAGTAAGIGCVVVSRGANAAICWGVAYVGKRAGKSAGDWLLEQLGAPTRWPRPPTRFDFAIVC